jgi:hypothetical protein
VSGVIDATAVAAATDYSCAARSDGTVACWGDGSLGTLGNGSDADSTTPVIVSDLSNAISVSADDVFACALLASGSVECWGNNGQGELGNGTRANSPIPVAVRGLRNAVSVSVHSSHACARLKNGAIECWGDGVDGELGDGSTADRLTPVAVREAKRGESIGAGSSPILWSALGGKVICGLAAGSLNHAQLLCAASAIPAPKNSTPDDGDPGFVFLGATGLPHPARLSQYTWQKPNGWEPKGRATLKTGRSWTHGRLGVTCKVTATDVRCTNRSHHGFSISRTAYRPF